MDKEYTYKNELNINHKILIIMGNSVSNMETCSICNETIDTEDWCKCIRCNIRLHNDCEKTYRGEKLYCECPYCHKIGSIGSYYVNPTE